MLIIVSVVHVNYRSTRLKPTEASTEHRDEAVDYCVWSPATGGVPATRPLSSTPVACPMWMRMCLIDTVY